jgi:hypothetical protein
MDLEMHRLIAKLRRDQPRNVDLLDLCSRAERMERALLAKVPPSPLPQEPAQSVRKDKASGGCPVCLARKQARAAQKRRERIRKTIPGRKP